MVSILTGLQQMRPFSIKSQDNTPQTEGQGSMEETNMQLLS